MISMYMCMKKKIVVGETHVISLNFFFSFFSHCPTFINDPIPIRRWSDRFEIWMRGSEPNNLQFEQWRSDLESRMVVFQSENSTYIFGF